jgi:methionyl-tRNA formyltransferase
VSYAPKLSLENAHLDFSLPAVEVYNIYRSVTPEPGAYIFIDGIRLKILKAQFLPNRIQSTGIISQDGKKILLGLKDGCLELHEVQPFGKKPMSAQSWWNGLRVHEIQAT